MTARRVCRRWSVRLTLRSKPKPLAGRLLPGSDVVSPGPLDPRSGLVVNPVNLPCWRNFPLVEEIKKSRGLPTVLDNDANAAALAEALSGRRRRVCVGVLRNDRDRYRDRACARRTHLSRAHRRCGGRRTCLDRLPGAAVPVRQAWVYRSAGSRSSSSAASAGSARGWTRGRFEITRNGRRKCERCDGGNGW